MPSGNPFSWRFVAPLYMGSTLNPINSSMIATALVPIAAFMHISVAQTTILVTALYLASSIAQPTAGKLSAEFGPRRVFLAGILMVLLGGLLGGFGRDLTMLVVSRILIGVGTSTAYPSAMLLIRRRAESAGMSKPPGNVLGALQIAGVVTGAVGLPIGGVLVDAWGWRTTFLVNIPFALVALVMAALWIPKDAHMEGTKTVRELSSRIDITGIHRICRYHERPHGIPVLVASSRVDSPRCGRCIGRVAYLVGVASKTSFHRCTSARFEPSAHPYLRTVCIADVVHLYRALRCH